jgi:hypothetical protein
MTWNLVLLLLVFLFCGLGIGLPIHSFIRLKDGMKDKGDAIYNDWWTAEKRAATNRQVLTVVIWTVVVVFTVTALLYWLDRGAGGFTSMLNYLSFASPCVAALIVGLGILEIKPHAQQPLVEVDFRYYFAGVPLLILGYVGFIGKNKSAFVTNGAVIMAILALAVPLLARRFFNYGVLMPKDRETDAGLVCLGGSLVPLFILYVRS